MNYMCTKTFIINHLDYPKCMQVQRNSKWERVELKANKKIKLKEMNKNVYIDVTPKTLEKYFDMIIGCPYCNHYGILYHRPDKYFKIECPFCDTATGKYRTLDEAILAWIGGVE